MGEEVEEGGGGDWGLAFFLFFIKGTKSRRVIAFACLNEN